MAFAWALDVRPAPQLAPTRLGCRVWPRAVFGLMLCAAPCVPVLAQDPATGPALPGSQASSVPPQGSAADTWANLVALADIAIAAQRYAAAAALLERAITIRPDSSLRLRLAEVQIRLGDGRAALATLEALGGDRSVDRASRIEALTRLGYLAADREQTSRAARAFEQAFVSGGRTDPALLDAAVTTLSEAGQPEQAIRVLQEALRVPGADPHLIEQARGSLVDLLVGSGRSAEAIAVLQAWIGSGSAPTEANRRLGRMLQEQNRCDEAIPVLERVLNKTDDAALRVNLALCLQQRSPELALAQLDRALAKPSSLNEETRFTANATRGYLLAGLGRHAAAAEAWDRALALRHQPSLVLARARSLQLAGDDRAARQLLASLAVGSLSPSERALYFDVIADLDAAASKPTGSIEALKAAIAQADTADRRQRLGQLQAEVGDATGAGNNLRRAVELDPGSAQRRLALAYFYRSAGRDQDAVPEFEMALRLDPSLTPAYADLGYAQKAIARNDAAARSFRAAIDRIPAAEPDPKEQSLGDRRRLYSLRREVAQLETAVSASAYYVRAPDVDSPSDSANPVNDQFPASGAGVDLAYTPPKVGFRNGRTLQAFGRVFWTAEDGPLPESSTVQAGIGLRYKPLRSQNLVLSGERLIAIGSDARNDWLLRAGYSFTDSTDLEPGANPASYTSIYADAAIIPTSDLPVFLVGEALQGISFGTALPAVAIPHLVAAANYVNDAGDASSGLYLGLGVRLRGWPAETRYVAGRVAVTLDLQYRQEVVGNREDSGVLFRIVAGF